MSSVFISGSITIKRLPVIVEQSIDRIIKKGMEILVGDADGVDTVIQNYCKQKNYSNVTVYSIYSVPRYKVNGFESKFILPKINSKRERELQKEKDAAMTNDSDYSLVVWDGRSKGSYANIIRAIEKNKKVKVYLTEMDDFIPQDKITKNEIDYLYRKNVGYTAKEIVEYLKQEGEEFFKQTRDFNKCLLEYKILKKDGGVYIPMPEYSSLFMVDKYRGRVRGVKFTNDFIDWVEDWIKKIKPPEEQSLF